MVKTKLIQVFVHYVIQTSNLSQWQCELKFLNLQSPS